ncbi:MAG: hypothetical protein IJS58_09795 [Bacilli bacterium]|nr:hypothetical protein [Bacilli bacterium]
MKKRKINKKAIWNLLSFIAGCYFLVEGLYLVIIQPFFTKQSVAFTPLGLIVFVLSIFVVVESGSYLYERINK